MKSKPSEQTKIVSKLKKSGKSPNASHSNPPLTTDKAAVNLSALSQDNGHAPAISASAPMGQDVNPPTPRVFIGFDTVPVDHIDDAPIVVPLGAGKWSHPEPYPFAVILALPRGAKISAMPRVCIYVSLVDGQIEFGDGVFAVRSKCSMIISSTPFVELSNALRLNRKDFSALLNWKKPEEPHMATKNWHERDTQLEVLGTQLGASAALRLFDGWAKMDKNNELLEERMDSVLKLPEGIREKTDEFNSRVNRFTKFCHKIGLKMTNKHNFSLQLQGLSACLALALHVRNHDAAFGSGG